MVIPPAYDGWPLVTQFLDINKIRLDSLLDVQMLLFEWTNVIRCRWSYSRTLGIRIMSFILELARDTICRSYPWQISLAL